MPNKVFFTDEKTWPKTFRALLGDGDLTPAQAMDTIDRLQEAGILFVEPAPKGAKADDNSGE